MRVSFSWLLHIALQRTWTHWNSRRRFSQTFGTSKFIKTLRNVLLYNFVLQIMKVQSFSNHNDCKKAVIRASISLTVASIVVSILPPLYFAVITKEKLHVAIYVLTYNQLYMTAFLVLNSYLRWSSSIYKNRLIYYYLNPYYLNPN